MIITANPNQDHPQASQRSPVKSEGFGVVLPFAARSRPFGSRPKSAAKIARVDQTPDSFRRQTLGFAKLETLLLIDAATGLPNARAWTHVLNSALAQASRLDDPIAVIYLDIAGLPSTDDPGGGAASTQILRCIAGMLRRIRRRSNFIARLANDRFAVLLMRTEVDLAHRQMLCLADLLRQMHSRLASVTNDKAEHAFGPQLSLVFGAHAVTAMAQSIFTAKAVN